MLSKGDKIKMEPISILIIWHLELLEMTFVMRVPRKHNSHSQCRWKGDYYRYLTEFKSDDDKKEVSNLSLKAYQEMVVCAKLLLENIEDVLFSQFLDDDWPCTFSGVLTDFI
ncbi:14-3-3 protein 8 [Capsicum chinense]|nr:14-3-3 protein 8 [Capsicum chinense]